MKMTALREFLWAAIEDALTERERKIAVVAPVKEIPAGNLALDWATVIRHRDCIELAIDRAGSVRREDVDGRLHIKVANISKACVSPYKGEEIPRQKELGLDPGRIYKLLRAPDELARAETVQSANNIQLMSAHVAVTAAKPKEEYVAGTLGSDAEFVAPYLRNSLAIWRQEDIDDIVSRDRCELSMGYRYDADMTPGSFEGERYDGVMRNIIFNHCALVEFGRAGPDVVVGDDGDGVLWALIEDAITGCVR